MSSDALRILIPVLPMKRAPILPKVYTIRTITVASASHCWQRHYNWEWAGVRPLAGSRFLTSKGGCYV